MEIELIKLIQKLNSNFFDVFFELISYFSNYFGLIFLFLILFIFVDKKYSIFFGITYGIGIGLNFLLKNLFIRPRPYEVDAGIINKITAVGDSFPSGHSVSATIIVCFILYYIWSRYNNRVIRSISIVLSILFIIFVGLSRMYLGQHYLSDILAGIAFGVVYSIFGIVSYKKICLDKQKMI